MTTPHFDVYGYHSGKYALEMGARFQFWDEDDMDAMIAKCPEFHQPGGGCSSKYCEICKDCDRPECEECKVLTSIYQNDTMAPPDHESVYDHHTFIPDSETLMHTPIVDYFLNDHIKYPMFAPPKEVNNYLPPEPDINPKDWVGAPVFVDVKMLKDPSVADFLYDQHPGKPRPRMSQTYTKRRETGKNWKQKHQGKYIVQTPLALADDALYENMLLNIVGYGTVVALTQKQKNTQILSISSLNNFLSTIGEMNIARITQHNILDWLPPGYIKHGKVRLKKECRITPIARQMLNAMLYEAGFRSKKKQNRQLRLEKLRKKLIQFDPQNTTKIIHSYKCEMCHYKEQHTSYTARRKDREKQANTWL